MLVVCGFIHFFVHSRRTCWKLLHANEFY